MFKNDPIIMISYTARGIIKIKHILCDRTHIGRYNHLESYKLREYRYTYQNLDIEYITAHSSKGTERDHE